MADTQAKACTTSDTQAKSCATSGSYSAQLLEQRLGVFQVGGVEALGEPAVDLGEHRTRLVAAALFVEQPREAHRRAQLPRLGTLESRDVKCLSEVGFRLLLDL